VSEHLDESLDAADARPEVGADEQHAHGPGAPAGSSVCVAHRAAVVNAA
jgi:hypothetical protein